MYGWVFFSDPNGYHCSGGSGISSLLHTLFLCGEDHILLDIGSLHIRPHSSCHNTHSIPYLYKHQGIQGGKIIQTTFTSAKLLSLFCLIIFGFLLVKESHWSENWKTGFNAMQDLGVDQKGKIASGWKPISGSVLLGAIAVAMVGSIFSSDAWNNVTFIAGEIKNPKRNIGLSLFLGTLIVTIIYVSANLMYLHVLPLQSLAFAENDR
jgi:APA family basic amino acid/polyamine antiporter